MSPLSQKKGILFFSRLTLGSSVGAEAGRDESVWGIVIEFRV